MKELLLVSYEVETPSEDTFTRIFTCPCDCSRNDIACDVLDAIDGNPTYTVRGREVDPATAVSALLSGQAVRRDYHDGSDLIIYSLRIVRITADEAATLRRLGLA